MLTRAELTEAFKALPEAEQNLLMWELQEITGEYPVAMLSVNSVQMAFDDGVYDDDIDPDNPPSREQIDQACRYLLRKIDGSYEYVGNLEASAAQKAIEYQAEDAAAAARSA